MHTDKKKQLNKEHSHSSTFDTSKLAMEQGMILLVAVLMIYVTPAVHGTSHLSFSNDTEVNITRDGCGTMKLCIETPDNCDPAEIMSVDCLFASLKVTPLQNPIRNDLMIELIGNSTGYIAVGLTANPSEGITLVFACANNNGTFRFVTAKRNNTNNMISGSERLVNGIRGMLNGSVIKCIFNVPAVNATETRSASSTFNVQVGSGTFDGSLGAFNVAVDSGSLNIALANATAAAPTTPQPNTNVTSGGNTNSTIGTTASCGAVHPHAVLLLLTVLSLSIVLGA